MYSIKPFYNVNSNPLKDFLNLSDFFKDGFESNNYPSNFSTRTEENKLTVFIKIPGIKKEFVSISTKDNKVILEVKKDETNTFSYDEFKQEFSISRDYNIDSISAKIENGILEINFLKKEDLKAKQIEIK